jgi:hypothetical protein
MRFLPDNCTIFRENWFCGGLDFSDYQTNRIHLYY